MRQLDAHVSYIGVHAHIIDVQGFYRLVEGPSISAGKDGLDSAYTTDTQQN